MAAAADPAGTRTASALLAASAQPGDDPAGAAARSGFLPSAAEPAEPADGAGAAGERAEVARDRAAAWPGRA